MTERTDELLQLANSLVSDYSERDDMLDKLEHYYYLTGAKEQDTDAEGEIELVRQPHGTNTIDLVQDLLSGADLTVTMPAPGDTKRERTLADTSELYCMAALTQSERAQRMDFISRATWLVAMRGCVAGRVMAVDKWLDQKEDDAGDEVWAMASRIPLQMQLRDPRYVYPKFTADGLVYTVERWTRTVEDIRSSYGDDMLAGQDATTEIKWTEYWSASEYCYWADGEPVSKGSEVGVGPWRHNLGGNPCSFEFGRQAGKEEPDKRVRPLLEGQRTVIDRMDLLDTMMATFIERYTGDALVVHSDELGLEGSSRPQISTQSGATNYLLLDEKIEWLHAGRQPMELQALRNMLQTTFERGTFPGTMYGEDPGRVIAGYAINMLNQSGQARMKPIAECLSRLLEDMFSNVLMVTEHHVAEVLGESQIEFHTFADAEDDTGATSKTRKYHTLDAKALDGYYHVEVRIGDLMPADEQANVILATRARDMGQMGRPLLSDETIYDKYGLVKNTSRERELIDRQMAWADPVVRALTQRLYAAEIVEELKRDLLKAGVEEAELEAILQQAHQGQQQEQEPQVPPEMQAMMQQQMMQQAMQQQMMAQQAAQPPMVPPGVMPPQMQGAPVPVAPGMPGQPMTEEQMLPGMMPPGMPGV